MDIRKITPLELPLLTQLFNYNDPAEMIEQNELDMNNGTIGELHAHMRVMMSVLSRRRGHICLPIVFTRIIKGMSMANSFCRTLLILYTKMDTQNSPSVWKTIMQEQNISMTASDLQSFSPESMRNIKVMDMSMDCI